MSCGIKEYKSEVQSGVIPKCACIWIKAGRKLGDRRVWGRECSSLQKSL